MKQRKGQGLLEYTIIAGLIAVAVVAIGPGFRRSAQAILKSTADVIGFQAQSEQAANLEQGFLNLHMGNSSVTASGFVKEQEGVYTSSEQQRTAAESVTYSNGAIVEP